MTDQPIQRRPGGRTARTRESVVRATTEILLGEGYEHLSIARVAAAAGVAETTIYRRWPTTHALAAEALADLARLEIPIPDTGSLESDLRALLTHTVRLIQRTEVQRIIRFAVNLDPGSGEFAEVKAYFWRAHFANATAIVTRAIERGELPQNTDSYDIIEDLVAVTYFRLLVTERPVDDRTIERSVHRVLHQHAMP
ncbi:TetR-like C-terminal domain-containing protein [Nocardia nova]|uniref:TetR-like C-terminal domain-containing protein n=1 Tax=Nocardia nova TaxID=37330 RepID=UPI0033D8E9D3